MCSETCKNVLYALDPSLTCSGWAVFHNGELAHHGYARTKNQHSLASRVDSAVKQMFSEAICAPTEMAIEWPQVYKHGKGDPNDLLAVAAVAGGAMAMLTEFCSEVKLYKPREWKGTISKSIMVKRILAQLTDEERAAYEAKRYPKTYAHNVVDAIGIGLHHLGRLK